MAFLKLTKEVIEVVENLKIVYPKQLTVFESLQIAVLIQKNALFREANVMDRGETTQPALEKIAIALTDLADGLNSIANNQ